MEMFKNSIWDCVSFTTNAYNVVVKFPYIYNFIKSSNTSHFNSFIVGNLKNMVMADTVNVLIGLSAKTGQI